MQRTQSTHDREKEKERLKERDSRDRQDNREHKKKKKHKDDRRSPSNDSRREKKHKKKHSRSRSDSEKKHKKHHRDHRDERQRQRQRQKRQRSRSNQKERRNRSRSEHRQKRTRRSEEIQQKERPHRTDEKREDHHSDQRRREPRDLNQKDPYFEQRRQIERVRREDPEKAEKMQEELQKQIIFDAKQRQYELMKEKFREAQKQLQEAKRQDHTILVYCLPLKAKEKDIWNFFSEAQCGKIRDIRIIRDQRSGKSKGVAYVEFYTSQSVEKALTMKQRPIRVKQREFKGLKIQHSQAQKNRAAAAAKQMKVTKQVDPYEQERQAHKRQTKVQIRGLEGKLADMQQSELINIFQPFGKIQYVDIHRDPETGKCKGFAFIQYENIEHARRAVEQMNGTRLLKGHLPLSVSTVSYIQKGETSTGQDYLRSQGSKMALMNSLAREAPSYSNLQRPPISTVAYPYIIMTNMFKMQGTTPGFFQNLKKEVQEQCSQFGIVEKIFVEKNNQGNVWIKFSDTATSMKAQENLNSKYFDGRKVFCYFVTEQTWNKRVTI